MAKKIPTSVFSRGTKLMGLAGKMAMNEISSRVKTWDDTNTKIQNKIQMAQDVVKTLSQLKGASMKLGQLVSMDMGDYLPPEVIKVLEQLQNNVTFLPYEKIEGILKKQLKDKFSDLQELSSRPIAAASIGQVHRAKLNGEDVVIKIQYPGVADTIPSDLKLLRFIVNNLSYFQNKEADMKPFFDEVEEVLRKEADYKLELKMQSKYREKFSTSDFIIPRVYPDYSTESILTQEYIEGISVNEWLKSNPSEDIRQKLADELMTLYLDEFFCHGMVQTDPNPGNFLITEGNKIALLDFGAVKEYSKEFIEGYRRVLKAAYAKDEKLILKESYRLKFIDERETEEAKNLYLKMMDLLAEPFRSGEHFDFTDKSFLNQSRDLTWELNKKCRYSPPPRDLLFLHRKLVGVFILIKKLGAKIRLNDYWYYVEEKS